MLPLKECAAKAPIPIENAPNNAAVFKKPLCMINFYKFQGFCFKLFLNNSTVVGGRSEFIFYYFFVQVFVKKLMNLQRVLLLPEYDGPLNRQVLFLLIFSE